MKKNNKLLAQDWFTLAKNDLGYAKLGLKYSDEFYSQICVQSHQAVEKYLKGFLVFHEKKPPKIHDLVKVRSFGSTLARPIKRGGASTVSEATPVCAEAVSPGMPGALAAVKLVKECSKIDKDFLDIIDDCAKITDYYVFLRYPVVLSPRAKSDAELTVNIAIKIEELISQKAE